MAAQGPVHVPWRADFAVGWGISGFSGIPAPKPWAFEDSARVQLNQLQERSDEVPGNISFHQGVVSSTEHYERAVRATVSLNIKAWGPVRGQASSEFLSRLEISNKTIHYIVVSRFETATMNLLTQQAVLPELSPFAASQLASIGPERWAELFGTHFIAGYVLGGLLIGKASFTSNTNAAALGVKAELEAKFGFFGTAQAQSGAQRTTSQEHCETNIEYHCTGAQMSNDQPSNVDGMIKAAQNYAQNNRGGKYHAILWPFSALNSYNVAEHQFMAADRPRWSLSGGHLLKMLNLEYAKLQRIEHTLTGLTGRPNADTREALVAVNRALRSFDRLENLRDLAVVDEDAEEYDEAVHDRIFAAARIENMMSKCSISELIAARQTHSELQGGESSISSCQQYKFLVSEGPLSISESQTLLSSAAGCCLLAPTLQSGRVFYLRFEIQHFLGLPGDELFLGVTTNTDPGGLWLDTDAGWFLQDEHDYNRKLTGDMRVHNGAWSEWRQGDQPVFKVDLVTYTLHVRLARLDVDYTARIEGSPLGAVFFCVTMHSSGSTAVKLLPVLPEHLF